MAQAQQRVMIFESIKGKLSASAFVEAAMLTEKHKPNAMISGTKRFTRNL